MRLETVACKAAAGGGPAQSAARAARRAAGAAWRRAAGAAPGAADRRFAPRAPPARRSAAGCPPLSQALRPARRRRSPRPAAAGRGGSGVRTSAAGVQHGARWAWLGQRRGEAGCAGPCIPPAGGRRHERAHHRSAALASAAGSRLPQAPPAPPRRAYHPSKRARLCRNQGAVGCRHSRWPASAVGPVPFALEKLETPHLSHQAGLQGRQGAQQRRCRQASREGVAEHSVAAMQCRGRWESSIGSVGRKNARQDSSTCLAMLAVDAAPAA